MRKTILVLTITLLFSACESQNYGNAKHVTTLAGSPFLFEEEIKGKPTIINFWASWCPFCKKELPVFQEFHESHPDILMIGINRQEDVKNAQRFWQKGGYTFQAILDPQSELLRKYNVVSQPTTIFLNEAGEIVERRDGPLTAEELNAFTTSIATTKELKPPTDQPIKIQTSNTPEFLNRWYTNVHTDTVQHIVDFEEILSGGVPKDGIPSIDNPTFISAKEVTFLDDNDTGSVFVTDTSARFYPFKILNWHEIINDDVDGQNIMVTYCPLCDSAAVYSRETSQGTTTFGVSGFLYQSNLIMYDRKTESLWNQITGQAMIGDLVREELELLPSNVVQWKTVKEHYPHAKVLSTETGYDRNYNRNPYDNYDREPGIMFPVSTEDDRLENKEKILGIIIDGSAKAYARSMIEGKTIKDHLNGSTIIITWENGKVEFLIDGKREEPLHAFWFAWVTQYPETEVYLKQ